MSPGNAIADFQALCHEYYTCFVLSVLGAERAVNEMKIDVRTNPNRNNLFIGEGHPDKGDSLSKIKIKTLLEGAKRNGNFTDMLAKSLLIRIYAEWDERYRHLYAQENGVDASRVMSKLMGEVRLIRNMIVHAKSKVGNEIAKINEIRWAMTKGATLHVSREMFADFIRCINEIDVYIEPQADFLSAQMQKIERHVARTGALIDEALAICDQDEIEEKLKVTKQELTKLRNHFIPGEVKASH